MEKIKVSKKTALTALIAGMAIGKGLESTIFPELEGLTEQVIQNLAGSTIYAGSVYALSLARRQSNSKALYNAVAGGIGYSLGFRRNYFQ